MNEVWHARSGIVARGRARGRILARLRAPWDPIAGRYRAPDEKTIRVVLDRLDPRALARALLGPRPRSTLTGIRRSSGSALT
jgi:hypothetical protein